MSSMESGKAYFYIATNLEWKKLLANDRYKLIITNSLKFQVEQKRIEVFSFIIMPNHMHLIWRINENLLPEKVQQSFMKYTAQPIIEDMKRNYDLLLQELIVNAKDRKYQFWERNPLAIELYSEEVIWQKLEYIHNNPCNPKWNLAARPEDTSGHRQHTIF
jgi:putative transposase